MRAMTASTLALVTAASIAAGLPAGAQSGCGASYTVAPGDTLARIAARCDTSVGALVRANDQIRDPSLIRVGWRLKIPGARADRDGFAEDRPTDRSRVSTGGTYRVEPGDTLFSIAQAAGISLAALMDANRGIDPYALAIGQALNLPGFGQPPADNPADSLRVSLEGHVSRGVECPILTTPDGDVYSLSGEMTFTPGEYVEVTGETMDASTCMQGTPLRVTALKEVQPPQDGREEEKTVRYEGRVASGAECPVLKTPDGDVYALVSDNVEFTPGEYVEVDGRLAEFSTCMQGEGTLDVSEIREIAPPEPERDPDRAEGPLARDYVLASWTTPGGSCARPDFAITGNSAGGQVVETSLNGAPRTGYVRLGDDPAFIFDMPRREMPLQPREPDGLAVFPPEGESVDLGGVRIADYGRVFQRC